MTPNGKHSHTLHHRSGKITNLFKHTNIKIAFKCNNTIAQLLKPANKTPHHTLYDRSGIYTLTCKRCQLAYVGLTSRNLKLRYQEHTRSIRNNNPTQHMSYISSKTEEYGPINTIMDLLKPLSSPSLLIPHELYFIHSFHKEVKLISEQTPFETNPRIQLTVDPFHEPPT